MNIKLKQHMVAAFIAVFLFAPAAWMLMDRVPPHVREGGLIRAADSPHDCGPDAEAPSGSVSPGHCVTVDWKIKTLRTCRPSSQFSTKRTIRDAENVPWDLAPVVTLLGKVDPSKRELVRNFILPSGVAIGPAIYRSTSCFTCNPLHVLWPVCVDKPDIPFMVTKP